MDLLDLKPAEERIVDIVHPGSGELLGVKVSLMSITDERLLKIKRKFQDEKLRLEARGKNFKSEDIEDNRHMLAFKAMTGWAWEKDATFKGAKPEFTMARVVEVFTALPWFQEQVEEAISDERAFFTKSKLA